MAPLAVPAFGSLFAIPCVMSLCAAYLACHRTAALVFVMAIPLALVAAQGVGIKLRYGQPEVASLDCFGESVCSESEYDDA